MLALGTRVFKPMLSPPGASRPISLVVSTLGFPHGCRVSRVRAGLRSARYCFTVYIR